MAQQEEHKVTARSIGQNMLTKYVEYCTNTEKELNNKHNILYKYFSHIALESTNERFVQAVQHGNIDEDCMALCTVLNMLPDIKTQACCSGHFKTTYFISLFEVSPNEETLSNEVSPNDKLSGLDIIRQALHTISDERPTVKYSGMLDWCLELGAPYTHLENKRLYWLKRPPVYTGTWATSKRTLLLQEVYKIVHYILGFVKDK